MFKRFLLLTLLLFSVSLPAQELSLKSNYTGDTLYAPALLKLEVISTDYIPDEPAYLNVVNNLEGYRKLKLGNNPNSIYSPKVNVLANGNNSLEIILRDKQGTADWSKIRLRPSAIGSLNLKKYVDEVGGDLSNWTTLHIPLSDFDPSIDFTELAYLEFPYSADAPYFNIDIAKIEFTGSNQTFLWFGNTKTDNLHDGLEGAGQLFANLVEPSPNENDLDRIELWLNDQLEASTSSYPFTFSVDIQSVGENRLQAKAYFTNSTKTSDEYRIYLKEIIPVDLGIDLVLEKPDDTFYIRQVQKYSATISGAQPAEPAYLHAQNNLSGYVKLKLGYDPLSIYAAGQNVIAGGNNTLSITLKSNTLFTSWDKILLRPKSIGSLKLETYILAAGGLNKDWITIQIPLSDFDPAIDFSNLNYMEFPYSANAGAFDFSIQSIVFTGGETPFLWFGENKLNNSHDGFEGAGQIFAEVVSAQTDEKNIQSVSFFVNDQLAYQDDFFPYQFEFYPAEVAEYKLQAMVQLYNEQTQFSEALYLNTVQPEDPLSSLDIHFLSPLANDSVLVGEPHFFIPQITGEDTETEVYLKVWNTETGYRKLKLGYDPNYIYGQSQDVQATGNDTLVIELKSFSGALNWSKIRIRPSAIGTLTLANYITDDASDWIRVKIPLTDFDASIDFSALSYIEFPYSADAGAFNIGVKELKFTGGETPFEWFGQNHYANMHDGLGGSGQLFAQLQIPSSNPILTDTVFLLKNGESIAFQTEKPFTFEYSQITPQTENFAFELVDNFGYHKQSEQQSVNYYTFNSADYSTLHLYFDRVPENLEINIAPLRYNKSFAYSLTLDDGKIDGFSYAFKLLNGGDVAETGEHFNGLYYTDGCGHSIPFKAALAWNSVNSSFYDIHIDTPDYITWVQLAEMIQAGWGVLNHSFSHAAYAETDYDFQITENQNTVQQKVNYSMNHFVVPSGDLAYVDPAFSSGNIAVYSNKIEFLGYPNGINIESPFPSDRLSIYRRYMSSDQYDTTNIMEKINAVARESQETPLWWLDFTHRVIPSLVSGSLLWNTFKYYMQSIEQDFGQQGLDNIWFAPQTSVLNYLLVRDHTTLNYAQNGQEVIVYLNLKNIPNLPAYSLSINVKADGDLTSVISDFSSNICFANNSATQKLINLEWGLPAQKRMQTVDFTTSVEELKLPEIIVYPNPITNSKLFIQLPPSTKKLYQLRLFTMSKKEITNKTFSAESGFNTFQLQLPSLPIGVYFLEIHADNQLLETKKIFIQ